MSIDVNHPLHKASFYLEELKYGPDARVVAPVGTHEVRAQLTALIRDAGLTPVDADELMAALTHYAVSTSQKLGLRFVLAKSVFLDGFMHGVAFAAGLEGRTPEVYK